VTAQIHRVYETYTDASNYSRAFIRAANNAYEFGGEVLGTGTARSTNIVSPSGSLYFSQNVSTTLWRFDSSGIRPETDNNRDLGDSTTRRFRSGYFATSVNVGSKSLIGVTTAAPNFGNYAGAGFLNLLRAGDGYGWTVYPNAGNALTVSTGSGGTGSVRATWTDSGVLTVNGTVGTAAATVAALPAAATAGAGARAFVTDATVTHAAGLGTAVVAGGANKVPVYSDGAAWLIG